MKPLNALKPLNVLKCTNWVIGRESRTKQASLSETKGIKYRTEWYNE